MFELQPELGFTRCCIFGFRIGSRMDFWTVHRAIGHHNYDVWPGLLKVCDIFYRRLTRKYNAVNFNQALEITKEVHLYFA